MFKGGSKHIKTIIQFYFVQKQFNFQEYFAEGRSALFLVVAVAIVLHDVTNTFFFNALLDKYMTAT